MQIGKYRVIANATGSQEGGWQGHVTRIWKEGGELHEVPHTYDAVFATEDEALKHAYEQSQLRVDEGIW